MLALIVIIIRMDPVGINTTLWTTSEPQRIHTVLDFCTMKDPWLFYPPPQKGSGSIFNRQGTTKVLFNRVGPVEWPVRLANFNYKLLFGQASNFCIFFVFNLFSPLNLYYRPFILYYLVKCNLTKLTTTSLTVKLR